jgi:hypothetical protein
MTRSIQTASKMAPSSLLLSTTLAACTVGPDYTPPKAELAPFHNLVDASTPQAHSAPPLDRWRDRQFRGLLWPRCPAKPLFQKHGSPSFTTIYLTMNVAALTIF